MDEVDLEIEQTRQELAQLRAHGALEGQQQVLESHQAYEQIKEREGRLKATMQVMYGKSSLHIYAQCIKNARDIDVASSYTLSLEAQVCRSVHHLVVLKKQLALVKKACDSVVDLLQGAIGNIIEENSLAEVNRINDLTDLDDEQSNLKEKYTIELEEQKEELAVLERREYEVPTHKNISVLKSPTPDASHLIHKDSKFINVSNNVMAVVKNDKVVSYVVRQKNRNNGWVPLSMSKATRSSSIRSLNRARPTIYQ